MEQKLYRGWTLKELLAMRKEASENGQVGNLQSINAIIAGYAKKYKLNYYEL